MGWIRNLLKGGSNRSSTKCDFGGCENDAAYRIELKDGGGYNFCQKHYDKAKSELSFENVKNTVRL